MRWMTWQAMYARPCHDVVGGVDEAAVVGEHLAGQVTWGEGAG